MGDALVPPGRLRYIISSDAAGVSSDVDGGRIAIVNGDGGFFGVEWREFVANSSTCRGIGLTTGPFGCIRWCI